MWFQRFLNHSHEKGILSWSSDQESLLAEAPGSHEKERETGLPKDSPKRDGTGASALAKKEAIRVKWGCHFPGCGDGSKPGYRLFMTIILKGNSYNPGNLDINVSKLSWSQNKYIHIFLQFQK